MLSLKKIVNMVDEILPEIIELRHKIHRNPEMAGNEYETAELLRSKLRSTKIELLPPFLETDVVGILNKETAGKNVTLRADIDALPLDELNDLPYKSRNPGIMHACGHDGHAAILAGAALVLDKLKDELKGSVRFVFQPGEEVVAMGKSLLDAGGLDNPEPNAVFALHAVAGYPAGTIITREGAIMAAAAFFKITITGKGGHGSKPEAVIDPILTGCRAVEALQSIVSRNIAPHNPVVISICRFDGGTNANILPESVEIEGTVRFLDNKVGENIHKLIERTLNGICISTGAKFVLEYDVPYIPTINTYEYVKLSKKVVEKYLGRNMWFDMEHSAMAGEDFSFYLKNYPGVFCFIGVGCDSPAYHNPKFDFCDNAIRNGILYFVGMTIEVIRSSKVFCCYEES